ncbi:hypothetical protein ACFL20_04515 [Spirochaetota bacterium]
MPFVAVGRFFQRRTMPVRDEDGAKGKSLIDEYMKEYKQKKN